MPKEEGNQTAAKLERFAHTLGQTLTKGGGAQQSRSQTGPSVGRKSQDPAAAQESEQNDRGRNIVGQSQEQKKSHP